MISDPEASIQINTSSFNKRPRPKIKLQLNVNVKTFEEQNIVVSKNSTSSYVIQNHPHVTDLSESISSSKYVHKKVFFGERPEPKMQGDKCYLGSNFYIVQKSNGKEMQDTYKAKNVTGSHNISFFAVYDGHSTQSIAETLADKLDEYILENVKGNMEMLSAIKEAFTKVEEEVETSLQEWKPRGGSTALCVIMYNGQMYVANLGDSRAVVYQNTSFESLSNLHDFSNASELQFAESKGAVILNNRLEGELAVSRSVGDIRFKSYMNPEPEIIQHKIQEQDEYLILGTDGYWNGLGPDMTLSSIQLMKEKSATGTLDLSDLGNSLIEEACQNIRTKKDNMTLIVVNMKEFTQKEQG